ncbi:DUF2088 domain-containing protein [Candidatus Sumerlaeota bacterium]|nr:DUF2088 domain-containing protein [Candidatus Sumerlaeota bacterium]
MEYFCEGSADTVIEKARASALLDSMLDRMGDLKRVILLPPDFTRLHSWAGELTVMLYEKLRDRAHVEVMPAIGTHFPMTDEELDEMFPGIPHTAFQPHDWRGGLKRLGEVPAEFVRKITDGKLDFPVYCEIARKLVEEKWDRIVSVGQLVPHEVIGIANQNKNVFVGTGGADTINKTHYIGAVCNMETIMGRAESPVRDVFNYMAEHFASDLPIAYVLTVRAKDASGKLVTRGLYAGDDNACFRRGATLCQEVNLDLLDRPLKKTVVYLDPGEFKSTWLGNKAIYRTRMAMADGGDLIVLAPGVREFGEDPTIDKLLRKYGYRGAPRTLELVAENEDLANNLSAAAHLIHGSSEGRFNITYCPGKLTREEIEGAGFRYGDLDEMLKRYNPAALKDGFNRLPDGEEIFYVSNPALGLWALKEQFGG